MTSSIRLNRDTNTGSWYSNRRPKSSVNVMLEGAQPSRARGKGWPGVGGRRASGVRGPPEGSSLAPTHLCSRPAPP